MDFANAVVLIITSLVVFPVSYIVNLFGTVSSSVILVIGTITLLGVVALPFLYAWYFPDKYRDPFFFNWSIFTFACVADLVIALENDKILHSFMAFYIVKGEPYLGSTHGTFINYWDGILHYSMYIFMVIQPSYNEKYRNTLLYWAGSIIHSVIHIMLTAFTGKFHVSWAILLNVAYLVMPVWMLCRVLTTDTTKMSRIMVKTEENFKYRKLSLKHRPIDLLFILYFSVAILFHCFRGIAVLDSKEKIAVWYIESIEPYLVDSVGFPRAQMLIYMFYMVPFYILTIYELLCPGKLYWMKDWALVMAGAVAQGQFSHVGASLHPFTSPDSVVPIGTAARTMFWVINMSLLLGPQFFAVKCLLEVRVPPTNYSTRQTSDKAKVEKGNHETKDYNPVSNYNLRKRKH